MKVDMTYPTGDGKEPTTMDQRTADILVTVACAGKSITYDQAKQQIEEIVK